MKIDQLQLENYRGFKEFSIRFDPNVNILIGDNGCGKTSLLDAVAIAASSFLRGIDGAKARNIDKHDVRLEFFSTGTDMTVEPQFPVKILCEGTVHDKPLQWTHTLNGSASRTTTVEARNIVQVGKSMQEKVRSGDLNEILPVVAYYGTGRLWATTRETKKDTLPKASSRFVGYTDCMDVKINLKSLNTWLHKMALYELEKGIMIPVYACVKKAMETAFAGSGQYTGGRIIYDLDQGLVVQYTTPQNTLERIPFDYLSDGYRTTISMIGDIARRMANLNPGLAENITEQTPGIVIIDEIDMHLHPKWQTTIVASINKIFPKVQFFFSTHSPNVIQSAANAQVIWLKDNKPTNLWFDPYGKDTSDVLKYVMGVEKRPKDIQDRIDTIYKLIGKSRFREATTSLSALTDILGEDVVLTELQTALTFEQLILED